MCGKVIIAYDYDGFDLSKIMIFYIHLSVRK
jgi:hypothetical protein